MNELFLSKRPQLEKLSEASAVYLSADSNNWVKEIINNFLTQYPFLQKEPVSITWTKMDPDKGYAVGSLNVIGASVPVIINEYRMSPLDVMLHGTSITPMNEYFLQKFYQKPEAFKGIIDKNTSSNLFGPQNALQFSPTNDYGNGVTSTKETRDAVKTASVFDSISSIEMEDAKNTLKEVQNLDLLPVYEANGTAEVFQKIANLAKKASFYGNFKEDIHRNLDIDRQYVFKDATGNYFVKQANSSVGEHWITEISKSEALSIDEMLTADSIEVVKTAGYTTAEELPLKKGESGTLYYGDKNLGSFTVGNLEKCAEQDKYASFKAHGTQKVVSLAADGRWITKEGQKMDGTLKYDDFKGEFPKIGSYGVFITKTASTMPFEVLSIIKTGSHAQDTEISAISGLEKVSFFPTSVERDSFVDHEYKKGAYIPSNAKFVKIDNRPSSLETFHAHSAKIKVEGLNGLNKVAFYMGDGQEEGVLDSKKLHLLKTAQVKEKSSFVDTSHTVMRDSDGFYSLVGPEFKKYAQFTPVTSVSKDDAVWGAIHCGATQEDVEKIASLSKRDRFQLSGRIVSPRPLDKIASMTKRAQLATFGENTKIIDLPMLVKSAAFLHDKGSVDAVLSLSMMRKRNVQEYVNVLPTYTGVVSELAKLLTAARLGLSGVDPDAIKDAMDAMALVVQYLEAVAARVKNVK